MIPDQTDKGNAWQVTKLTHTHTYVYTNVGLSVGLLRLALGVHTWVKMYRWGDPSSDRYKCKYRGRGSSPCSCTRPRLPSGCVPRPPQTDSSPPSLPASCPTPCCYPSQPPLRCPSAAPSAPALPVQKERRVTRERCTENYRTDDVLLKTNRRACTYLCIQGLEEVKFLLNSRQHLL